MRYVQYRLSQICVERIGSMAFVPREIFTQLRYIQRALENF